MSFAVVILSARAANLVPCIQALLAAEPDLPPEQIIVVDDGARAEAEPLLPPIRWVAGERPFIFARNANLGIRVAGNLDCFLLNDDARLISPQGFTHLAEQAAANPSYGLISAAVHGAVGNHHQHPLNKPGIRTEPQTLAFVCAFIPRRTVELLGPLDERFVGYGYEDTDYCTRALARGLRLGIFDGCVVEHESLPSTFRTRSDIQTIFAHNRRLYQAKQQGAPAPPLGPEPTVDSRRRIDLLYLAFNRFAFTRETFTALITNTDWDSVHELVVYDDGSIDGTDAWLEHAIRLIPAPVRFQRTHFGSPVTAMVDFIERAQAPILAKVDSDAMMPPGWLRQSLAVLDRFPDLDLLGIEAMNPHVDDQSLERNYTPAEFMSGLGLYRRKAFASSRPTMHKRYFGLEEWQVAQGSKLTRGWINPALPVFLLDRMPLEPWATHSAEYIRHGWQRYWPPYDRACTLWHWRWPSGGTASPVAEPTTPPHSNSSIQAVPAAPPGRLLQLRYCDDQPLSGYEVAQIMPFASDGAIDLRQTWPWPNQTFSIIHAWDIVEHLPDQIHTMNELWRILIPGGDVDIVVPTTDGSGAFQDPTHVSFWNRNTFRSFEAGTPQRSQLSKRTQLRAAFHVISERTETTIDGPRLTIRLRAVDPSAAPRNMSVPTIVKIPSADSRFIGALRVKNEAVWIGETLERALHLCERVVVFDDHSTDETRAICHALGDRITVIESPFEGLDEARDKNYLLKALIASGAAWVLWIDGDEVLERTGAAKIQQAIRSYPHVAVMSLRIAYLWDRVDQVRTDGIWGRFVRPSLFRLAGQPVEQLHFPRTSAGGNFHCGNVPRGLIGTSRTIDVRLKHYGYLQREWRQAKYRWYNMHDPDNELEDRYRHIAEIPGARHAPGPARMQPWRE